MENDLNVTDKEIRSRLRKCTEGDKQFWSFRTGASRDHVNSIFKYPAMMVPRMQERLISTIVDVVPRTSRLFEPFVGAGTVMLSAMRNRLSFTGQDINPLAILLCQTKSGPFFVDALSAKSNEFLAVINSDRRTTIEASFTGLKKWFRDDVSIELSKVRRSIRKESHLWCRRFYWVALAETVRRTSNSRTTTFKLHMRPPEEVRAANGSPIQIFSEVLKKNITCLASEKRLLTDSGALERGRYKGNISLRLRDTAAVNSESKVRVKERYDLLVTSPPYGDNKTTIPYGQHSFLPLQWIDLADISEELDERWISSTHEIDSRSLGGSLRKALPDLSELLGLSKTLRKTIHSLKQHSDDREVRVAAFWRDFGRSLDCILPLLKPNAYMIWTVGNRTVGGHSVPMDRILQELLTAKGGTIVDWFKRPIPTKRMAKRNNVSKTMCSEVVVIARTKTE